LVRVVLVPPAVGEPLAEPRARDLTAQLGLEAPPASRVPLLTARSMSRSSACRSARSGRAKEAMSFMRSSQLSRQGLAISKSERPLP
jgi:hypothetical protein